MTKQTPYMKPAMQKKEQEERNCLGTVSSKTTGGLKQVLLARNLTLNSHVAPNYKHRLRLTRGPLPHLCNITVKHV